MMDREDTWTDDSVEHEAAQRARRATRLGWTAAIGCTTGAVGCALITAAVLWLAVVAVGLFVALASN